MDLDREQERAALVAIAIKQPEVEAELAKARAKVARRVEKIDEQIKALQQERSEAGKELGGLQNAAADCNEARARLFGRFVDRKLLQARDRAQNEHNKASRDYTAREGRFRAARADLDRQRRKLKPEALTEWEKRLQLEEAELANYAKHVSVLREAAEAAQAKVEDAYQAVLRGPAQV